MKGYKPGVTKKDVKAHQRENVRIRIHEAALNAAKGSQHRTDLETPARQAKNAVLRKGMKRPEHGPWPIAK